MSLPPDFRRVGLFLAVMAGPWLRLAAQDAVHEEPLQLPVYTVTAERELPPPESWLYVRIPGFEVLSNASEGKTKDLLDSFQRFANAVGLVWPGMEPPTGAPAALIICGSGDQFGAFLPEAPPGTDRATASLTLRSREQSAIVMDVQTSVLHLGATDGDAGVAVDDDGIATGSGADPGVAVDAYRQLNREYLRFLLAGVEPRPPAWFAEGLAQLFMAMEITETSITLGKLEDPNLRPEASGSRATPKDDRDFNAALARKALLPLPDLFAVPAESELALNPIGSVWAKQCYAFVHWGLYGDQGGHQRDFLTFVARLAREPVTEALFKECFKKSYADMLQTLRSYLEYTRYKVAGLKTGKGEKIAGPLQAVVRAATEAEIGRIKGETLVLAGQQAEGRRFLVTAYRRGERDPALLAALGLAEFSAGESARSLKLLEAAAAANVGRPRAYVALARLRLKAATAAPEGAGGKHSRRQTAGVLEPLFTGRGQKPPLPELYELIAEAWAQCEASPTAAQLAVLDEGVRLFPRNTVLVYGDAALKAKAGLVEEAESLIRLGLRVATDADTRERFTVLQAGLPVRPPVPATK